MQSQISCLILFSPVGFKMMDLIKSPGMFCAIYSIALNQLQLNTSNVKIGKNTFFVTLRSDKNRIFFTIFKYFPDIYTSYTSYTMPSTQGLSTLSTSTPRQSIRTRRRCPTGGEWKSSTITMMSRCGIFHVRAKMPDEFQVQAAEIQVLGPPAPLPPLQEHLASCEHLAAPLLYQPQPLGEEEVAKLGEHRPDHKIENKNFGGGRDEKCRRHCLCKIF